MKLAIIIPYYKIRFFKETLESLASQTDKRFNLYIGDDASPEDPHELLKPFQNRLDFTYHRFRYNLGKESLVKQWDRCIALSEDEEWFMILGDDDVLAEDVVEKFHEHVSKYKDIFVIRYIRQVINENSDLIFGGSPSKTLEKPFYSYFNKVVDGKPSSLSEFVFKKDSYLKVGFYNYPLAWCSDDRSVVEFSQEKPIYSMNDTFVKVRLSKYSISGSNKTLQIKQLTELKFQIWFYDNFAENFTKKERICFLNRIEFISNQRNLLTSKTMKWFFLRYISIYRIIIFLKFLRRYFIWILFKGIGIRKYILSKI